MVGLAGGIGFDMFETTFTYIGTGQGDWIVIALVRVGASLLHGLGAGMVALGWYYFINGRGVRRRWLKGVACILYAVLQHGIYNGAAVVVNVLPTDTEKWLNSTIYLGKLPLQVGYIPFFALDALILLMLIFMTGRLLKGWRKRNTGSPLAPAGATVASATPAPIGGVAQ
jgi:hypothetical protein